MTIELSTVTLVCALQALIILVSCGVVALPPPDRGYLYLHLWCQFRREHCCCCELRVAGLVHLVQKATRTDVPVIMPCSLFVGHPGVANYTFITSKTKCDTNRRRVYIVRHVPTSRSNIKKLRCSDSPQSSHLNHAVFCELKPGVRANTSHALSCKLSKSSGGAPGSGAPGYGWTWAPIIAFI